MATSAALSVGEIDLSDMAFWVRPPDERARAFAILRAQPQPVFFREQKIPLIPQGAGYYALTRHADVIEASRIADVFSSEPCSNSIADLPGYLSRYFGSMINMDDPRHAKIRRIVSRAFTPRVLAKLENDLEVAAAGIVDDLIKAGPCDFVTSVAAQLPVRVICDMMGIPAHLHDKVLHRTNIILGSGDPEYTGVKPDFSRWSTVRSLGKLVKAGHDLHRLAMRLGRQRRRHPVDDLTSALVNANVDGEHLTGQELGSFFILLVVAGNETTRNAISHALALFTDHPQQRDLLLADFDGHIGPAVEEVIRYATPVIQFRRTLTRDYQLNGCDLRAGDKVLLFYNSANRDESVFDDPFRFDVTRTPNDHVAFGGGGPHFCLGANLARREIKVMFEELFRRLPDIEVTGEPAMLQSNFIHGIKRMPVRFTPA
jgi:methyl-branched lipid omega-hydroxylase